jgi:hypothetical protein
MIAMQYLSLLCGLSTDKWLFCSSCCLLGFLMDSKKLVLLSLWHFTLTTSVCTLIQVVLHLPGHLHTGLHQQDSTCLVTAGLQQYLVSGSSCLTSHWKNHVMWPSSKSKMMDKETTSGWENMLEIGMDTEKGRI